MVDNGWLDEHIELYAIDVLPADEAVRVRQELDQLPPMERSIYEGRIAEARETVADLASAHALDAPDELRGRVFEYVFAAEQDASDDVITPISEARSRRSRIAFAVAGAAVVAAVALGAGWIIGRTTAPVEHTEVTEAQQQTLDVLSAPDANVSVAGLDDDRGTISLVASQVEDRALALVRDVVNPLPQDTEFQLWWLGRAEQPISAGLLDPAEAGDALVTGLEGSTGLAVTIEPEGGSAQPTTPILAQFEF